ncbi:MAG: MFS transporter [Nitrososphaerota archaeon]|nr:MFS transporter [Nitrososphaerota archaeon]
MSGMGFFTDAYDLFIIGAVLTLLPLAGWGALTALQTSLLASTALIAAVLGALVFGRLLDHLGRKAVYGLELVILVVGALGSAFLTPVNGVYILMAWRFLLGIGIGGDYSTSSTIMAEYSNTKKRGMLVGMVFSMQSIGLLAGPLITLGLLLGGVAPALAWKLLLAIGALPALLVIYWRRRLPETPKYSLGVRGDVKKASEDLKKFTGMNADVDPGKEVPVVGAKWYQLLTNARLLALIIGTAGTWFLMDWALYGNSIMSSTMLSFLVPSTITGIHHLIMTTEYTALIFGVAAFPGYWLATFTIDRIGRKPIQMAGFLAMAISFGLLGLLPGIMSAAAVGEFLALYGISYFFIEFGPNVTTFIYPPEVYPVSVRGLGAGASAAGGKIGAFLGTLLNLAIIATVGEGGLFLLLALFSVAGLVLTMVLLPETKLRPLEESSMEDAFIQRPVPVIREEPA